MVWAQSTARQNEVRAPAANLPPKTDESSKHTFSRQLHAMNRSPTTLVNTSFDQLAAGPPPERGAKRDGQNHVHSGDQHNQT
jgi:hypothetical protein